MTAQNTTLEARKQFIKEFAHANPKLTPEKISLLYDRREKQWPEITRGGHRKTVWREKAWENIIHTCPECGLEAQGIQDIKDNFGIRFYAARGKAYVQSWCGKCRNKGTTNGAQRAKEGRKVINPVNL
jgi:hypothetical protein